MPPNIYSFRELLRHALMFGVLLLCIPSVSSARSATLWPADRATMEQIGEYIRHLTVARWLEGEGLARHGDVQDFYRNRDYRPAWIATDGVRLEAAELLQVLEDAGREGLEPADYHVDALEKSLRNSQPDPVALARLDIMLSDAFIAYGSDVRSGRTDPRQVDPRWLIYPSHHDMKQLLDQTLSEGSVTSVLRSMPPTHRGYQRLREALQRYRVIATRGGWDRVEPGPPLKPGMRNGRVFSLRQRLHASADLKDIGTSDPAFFDAELKSALENFQNRHGLEPDGVAGPDTLDALNVPVATRIAQIRLNLERWRWLPRTYEPRYIIVNTAGFELKVIEETKPVMRMRVIVGKEYRQTPALRTELQNVVLNPYWYVPPGVLRRDILPAARRNPEYLATRQFKVFERVDGNIKPVDLETMDLAQIYANRSQYMIRQDPGPRNALGRIKFTLDNPYNIYLHDTPNRSLFNRTVRTFSSGCIRLEKPLELAEYILEDRRGWTIRGLARAIEAGKTRHLQTEAIPVYLVYWTTWVDGEGQVQFRDDIYGRDKPLMKAIRGPGQIVSSAALAQKPGKS